MTDAQPATARVAERRATIVARRFAAGTASDSQLLYEFAAHNDAAAFAQIVRRYGPAVFGTCRRVLRQTQDAEDAFQATFLVLARKAGSVRKGESLAGWLHGVAYRVAMRAKRDAARRRKHEARAQPRTPVGGRSPDRATPGGEVAWRELRAVLDEEVAALPPIYRDAFVLCCLNGHSQADAAGRLGVKEGTVSSRLTHARKLLREALAGRGVTLSAVLTGLALVGGGAAAVPKALADATAQTATRFAQGAVSGLSAKVLTLAEGALKTMLATKVKLATVLLLTLSLFGAGAALTTGVAGAERETASEPPARGFALAPGASKPTPRPPESDKPDTSIPCTGRVLDPEGKPVRGAKVFVWANDKSGPRTITDAEGRFRLKVRPAAVGDPDARLVATAEGYGPNWVGWQWRPKKIILRLVKDDVPITGRILDLEGKPIAGLRVEVSHLEAPIKGGDLTPWIRVRQKRAEGDYVPGVPIGTLDAGAMGMGTPTTTDKEGRFRLSGFGRERVVHLRIRGKAIENTLLEILTRPGPLPKLKARLSGTYPARFEHLAAPGKSIVGTVRDKQTGKPIAGIHVRGASGKWIGTGFEVRAVTDEKGRYELAGLSKRKEYWVAAEGGPGRPYFNHTKFAIADTPGLEPITVDFELERGIEINGRLTDKATGKPIQGEVSYRVFPTNPHRKDYPSLEGLHVGISNEWGRTGPDGTFTVLGIPGPAVLIVAAKESRQYSTIDLVTELHDSKGGINAVFMHPVHTYKRINPDPDDGRGGVTPPLQGYDIALEPGRTLTGSIVGPDGKPLTGTLALGLETGNLREKAFMSQPPPEKLALKKPEFTAGGLNPRRPRCLVFFHSEKQLGKIIKVGGDEPTPFTVRLDPLSAAVGRVVDADGRPCAGATVTIEVERNLKTARKKKDLPWSDLFMAGVHPLLRQTATTDREGKFRVEGLLPGLPYRVRADKGKTILYYQEEGFEVEAGKVKDLGDLKSASETKP